MDDNEDYVDYEDHGYEDDLWHVVNIVNMVDDNMDVHIADMVDDMVVVENKHKKDEEVLELMEHFEPVE